MGTTGSSDAHEIQTLGCYFTEFDRPIHSIQDFVTALKEGRGRPRHRPGARLTSGPVPRSSRNVPASAWEPDPSGDFIRTSHPLRFSISRDDRSSPCRPLLGSSRSRRCWITYSCRTSRMARSQSFLELPLLFVREGTVPSVLDDWPESPDFGAGRAVEDLLEDVESLAVRRSSRHRRSTSWLMTVNSCAALVVGPSGR